MFYMIVILELIVLSILLLSGTGSLKTGQIDLVFGVPSTSELGEGGFDGYKSFVKNMIKKYRVAKTDTHVGIMQTGGGGPKVILPLSEGISKEIVDKTLDAMSFQSGGQNLPEALQLASTEMFSERRPGASKYFLFGSSGCDKVCSSVLEASAKPLVDQGVSLMPVVFGAASNSLSLRSISSVPSGEFFLPAKVEQLEKTVGLASKVVRSGRVTKHKQLV